MVVVVVVVAHQQGMIMKCALSLVFDLAAVPLVFFCFTLLLMLIVLFRHDGSMDTPLSILVSTLDMPVLSRSSLYNQRPYNDEGSFGTAFSIIILTSLYSLYRMPVFRLLTPPSAHTFPIDMKHMPDIISCIRG